MSQSQVLVPVDGSPASLRAVDFAIEMSVRRSFRGLWSFNDAQNRENRPTNAAPLGARCYRRSAVKRLIRVFEGRFGSKIFCAVSAPATGKFLSLRSPT